MKTVSARRTYWKGLLAGVVAGLPLAAAFASLFGGEHFTLLGARAGGALEVGELERAIVGACLGFLLGLTLGLGAAAFTVAASSHEARDHLGEPEPLVEDGGLGRTFPGVFGSADPYEPFKRRIEAEEGKEPAPAPPAVMPDTCPSCGKKLDAGNGAREPDDPVAFCYHCGAPLA